jgi:hypothetical protein
MQKTKKLNLQYYLLIIVSMMIKFRHRLLQKKKEDKQYIVWQNVKILFICDVCAFIFIRLVFNEFKTEGVQFSRIFILYAQQRLKLEIVCQSERIIDKPRSRDPLSSSHHENKRRCFSPHDCLTWLIDWSWKIWKFPDFLYIFMKNVQWRFKKIDNKLYFDVFGGCWDLLNYSISCFSNVERKI